MELVSLGKSLGEDLRMALPERIHRRIMPFPGIGQTQANFDASPSRNREIVARSSLASGPRRIHGIGLPVDHRVMEGVLGIFLARGASIKSLAVGLVMGEEEFRRLSIRPRAACQVVSAHDGMAG